MAFIPSKLAFEEPERAGDAFVIHESLNFLTIPEKLKSVMTLQIERGRIAMTLFRRAKITEMGLTAGLALLLGAIWLQAASAHKGATGVVKQRMDAMQELKTRVKTIDQMLSGKKRFSKAELLGALEFIKRHGGARMTELFPKGSTQKPSEAEPAIWRNWQTFELQARQLTDTAEAFRKKLLAQTGRESVGQVFKLDYLQLRKSCKVCHDEFRQ